MSKTKEKNETKSEKQVKKFRLFKFISIFLLIAFLLGGLILFENDITVENLRYLVKYLDFSSSGAFSEESVIYYNADSGNDFYVFRGDLALVNPGGLTLFDRRGSAVLTDSFNMSKPVCVCGEKYLAVYDLGGHQVRIYNSFSLLSEKNFDYTVQAVSINSDGSFCVVSSEKNYRSAVFVFDRDFEPTYQWLSSDKYAVNAYLSDQDLLSIAAVQVENGELVTDLIELKIGDKKNVKTFTTTGDLPLKLYTDRKGTTFLTDQYLRRIEKGEEVFSEKFPVDSIAKVAIGEKQTAILQDELSVGVNYRLRVFDNDGEETISHKFSVSVRDVKVFDDSVYVLTHTELYVFNEKEEVQKLSLDGDYSTLGVFSENCVILCSDTKAQIRILD